MNRVHGIRYWLSATGDLSRRHWSEVRNYSKIFQDQLQSLGSFFEGLGPNPDNVDARWEQMENLVGMIRENLRVVPVSFNFFAGTASLRLWFDFVGANLFAAAAIITAIVKISG